MKKLFLLTILIQFIFTDTIFIKTPLFTKKDEMINDVIYLGVNGEVFYSSSDRKH